jgi:hypothetical protein
MTEPKPLLVWLTIYVDPNNPALCNASSSAVEQDGCPCFMRDEDGDPLCGAFMMILKQVDPDENAPEAAHYRTARCLEAEIP